MKAQRTSHPEATPAARSLTFLALAVAFSAQVCLGQIVMDKNGHSNAMAGPPPFGFTLNFVEGYLKAGKLAEAVAALEKAEARQGYAWDEPIAGGLFLLGLPRQANTYARKIESQLPKWDPGRSYLTVLYQCSLGHVDAPAVAAARSWDAGVFQLTYGDGFGNGNYSHPKNEFLPKGNSPAGAEFIAYLAGAFENSRTYFAVLMARRAVSYEPKNPLGSYVLGYFYTANYEFKRAARRLELALNENPGTLAPAIKTKLAEALRNIRKEEPTPSP